MIVLVGLYNDPSAERLAELAECLRRNLENPHVEAVHVFLEFGGDPEGARAAHASLRHPKAVLVPHGRRVTFRELFAYANECLRGRRVAIANSDIYFDRTLARLAGEGLGGRLLCLSRWDVQPDGSSVFFDNPHSQDAWVFEAPIRPFACDWHLGLPGCDNRLTFEAARAGLDVSNPSRTVRAHHLHTSNVRRYTERQRLPGPVLAVPGTVLGAPWVTFVVTTESSDDGAERTATALAAQARSDVIMVGHRDDLPGRAGSGVTVLPVDGPRAARARLLDRGVEAADEDASLCFVAPGASVAPTLSSEVLGGLAQGGYVAAEGRAALACSREQLARIGGFDEALSRWSDPTEALREALRALGLPERRLSPTAVSCPASMDAPAAEEIARERAIDAGYVRALSAVITETGQCLSWATRREIRRGVERRWYLERSASPEVPCAPVTFREAMGYAVRRLAPGVSSHSNDPRPFRTIPACLAGRSFTQVVASRVSPVEVEFRGAGKLYVLVGTDWHGYGVAARFLRERGLREPVASVETQRGTGFEVWSLLGDAGDRFVLPTQVMLVSDDLERGEGA
jgi:hypothetical protein